uniref:Reverse transcriptase n=1 Tax=Leptobrachium leishanense TaxID=445787 RepID=A0A8C5MVQ8_9ANUR
MMANCPKPLGESLLSSFPFRACKTSLRYLGLNLTPHCSDLFQANYVPILTAVEKDLSNWQMPHVTWFGRMSVLKMNILPRLLYIFQTLPIAVPSTYFRRLKSIFTQYVWGGKAPRLSQEILTAPKHKGGAGLPDMLLYYQATHLLRQLEWNSRIRSNQWVELEEEASSIALADLPWLPNAMVRTVVLDHPTVLPTMAVWRRLTRCTSIAPFPSPLMPVNRLPSFTPHLHPNSESNDNVRPDTFLDDDQPKPLNEIPLRYPNSFLTRFHHHRLITNLLRLAPLSAYRRPQTEYETLSMTGKVPQHGISHLYSLLQRIRNT